MNICLLPQTFCGTRFQIDHVISLKHNGKTEKKNLALACLSCNLHKGSDITSVDVETGRIMPLFNPRKDKWDEDFDVNPRFGTIEGKTATGRATVELLKFNTKERVLERRYLIELGELSVGK